MDRPVLRYFGGKFMLAPWIISHMPKHRVYCEPYGGAASVLMQKPRSYAEVYNDLDSEVVTLFKVLRNGVSAKQLCRSLELTPFSREEFNSSYEEGKTPVEISRKLIIRSFMGFGANGHNAKTKTGFRANSNRSGTPPAHDWANYPDCLSAFCERLSGVVIENRDALEVIKQQDSAETLHFVDTPYVHASRGETRAYKFEMSDEAHVKLLSFLGGLSGMVMLCGYDSEIYEQLDWVKITKSTHADGANDRTECLWLNPAAALALPQAEMFREAANT